MLSSVTYVSPGKITSISTLFIFTFSFESPPSPLLNEIKTVYFDRYKVTTGRYDNYSMIINFIITRDVMKYIFLKILRQFLSYNYVAHCTRNIWGNFYLKFNLFKKEKLLEDIFFSNRTFFFFFRIVTIRKYCQPTTLIN